MVRGSMALGGSRKIVGSVPQFNIRSEQKPIASRLAEPHAHACGIDDTSLPIVRSNGMWV